MSKTAEIIAKMRIPRKFIDYKFKDLIGISGKIEIAKKAMDEREGLLIQGDCGSGKTHLSTCLMKYWVRQKINNGSFAESMTPLFVNVPELYGEWYVATWSENKRLLKSMTDNMAQVHLLVLDDFKANIKQETFIDFLYQIVNRRYNNMNQTIVTTNLSLKQISEIMDDRLASRLSGFGQVIGLGSKDYRAQGQSRKD